MKPTRILLEKFVQRKTNGSYTENAVYLCKNHSFSGIYKYSFSDKESGKSDR